MNHCSLRSRRRHKAWGGARLGERNPRILQRKRRQPVKRATAQPIREACARSAGSHYLFLIIPGVTLPKPRFTPGYTLTPASQAE